MFDPIVNSYAHRGLWDATRPENSLAAFHAAVVAGVGIELDVRLSADGVAMVFHDQMLDRMTNASG
ncbi:MAG: glycerophosphodiester phosphodiesterase family protein, partial [Pseudomonadota bacterium]